jgi:hypothetical protein
MDSGLTNTPEQHEEARRQSRERMRKVLGGKLHDGSQPTVEEVLQRESAHRGANLVIKKEGSE